MLLHVREAKHLRDYVVWLRFNDGAEGEIDLLTSLANLVRRAQFTAGARDGLNRYTLNVDLNLP